MTFDPSTLIRGRHYRVLARRGSQEWADERVEYRGKAALWWRADSESVVWYLQFGTRLFLPDEIEECELVD
jgi:hypothetical protein